MGRNDADLLPVPERAKVAPESASPEKGEQAEAQSPEPEEQEVRVTPPALERCPHCDRSLSSIDIKTNHCFQCGAALVKAPAEELPAPDDFTVRI